MSTILTKNMARKTEQTRKAPVNRRSAGFTLIELLTVIAVIAILAAIIFPVYQKVMENARQHQAIDNMHRIQEALAQYYLDNNHKYPPVLFAYSNGTSSMRDIKNAGPQYLKGLYPNYINDASVFIDPNNPIKDTSSNAWATVNVNALNPDGSLSPVQPAPKFFLGDAYDISPHIVGPNNTDNQPVPRYQTAWTATPPPAGSATRQLDQPTATDDTYVTMTTYHVKNADKIIVLFKNGTISTLDTSRVLSPDCGDVSDITTSQAKFWMIEPKGACP